jgi:hypothetical protein
MSPGFRAPQLDVDVLADEVAGFLVAALLDIGHWTASATQRNQLPGRRASAT